MQEQVEVRGQEEVSGRWKEVSGSELEDWEVTKVEPEAGQKH